MWTRSRLTAASLKISCRKYTFAVDTLSCRTKLIRPAPPVLVRTKHGQGGKYPPFPPASVSYSYRVRACLILTVHGPISCADPLRPARRSTYHICDIFLLTSRQYDQGEHHFLNSRMNLLCIKKAVSWWNMIIIYRWNIIFSHSVSGIFIKIVSIYTANSKKVVPGKYKISLQKYKI